MKLTELQNKIADVLGVSASQKELAFEIFVGKISEILLEHITLKVPRVGYFQLKTVPAKDGVCPLIFSPFSGDLSRESGNLYLTIDVVPKMKNAPEFDSNIFSIGVGKPLLPLSIDELQDTETSYAMLKKSIEERVKELLMESDQIPNFNIWDDYYKSAEEYEEESVDETKTQLYELTSDLEFKEEMITDKIPEDIVDDFNLPSNNPDQTSLFDHTSLSSEENKSDDLIIPTKKESERDSGDILLPPDERADIDNTIYISPEEEDYPALKDLPLDDVANNNITISDLLDDLTPVGEKNESTNNISENVVPIQETLDRILADESVGEVEKKVEKPIEDQSDQKSSSFEVLHNICTEVISSSEIIQTDDKLGSSEVVEDEPTESKSPASEELQSVSNEIKEESPEIENEDNKEGSSEIIPNEPPGQKISTSEELHELSDEVKSSHEMENDSIEESSVEEEEKIEWNWGDELKEEFGIPAEDSKYEIIEESEIRSEGDLKLVDDFLEDEKVTKNLFTQLEKTIEREFNYDEEPKHRLTVEDKKATQEKDTLKKVLLEFSGPPSKYEFIEDRKSEKEKRMAITLMEESNERIKKPSFDRESETRLESKDSYFGKMFLIIFSAFIVVAAVVVFIIINGNNTNQVSEKVKPIEEGETSSVSDSRNSDTLTQSNSQTNDLTTLSYDDMSDFPRTATPPVSIKDATDRQILETIKNETAKYQPSQKVTEKPVVKLSDAKSENQGVNKSVAGETKVSNRIFSDGKNYYLQVSSWHNRIRAEEEVNRLRALGFNAFIVEANLPQKGGIWYRVRVGPFRTEIETDEFMKKNNL